MAAGGNFVLDKGYRASVALTKYYAVKMDASNAESVTPVTADTDVVAGFAQFGVTTAELNDGKGGSIRVDGITVAVATGAIALGALVTVAPDGRVTSVVSNKRIVGTCVGSPSTNAGDRISLLFKSAGHLAP